MNTVISITASHMICLSCFFPILITGLINVLVKETILLGSCHLYKKKKTNRRYSSRTNEAAYNKTSLFGNFQQHLQVPKVEVLHFCTELWLYGPSVVQFHQAQTSQTLVQGTVHVLFDGTAAPKNKEEIISTNKRRRGRVGVRIHFVILFGSSISRLQALSQAAMPRYRSRMGCLQTAQCCPVVLHFLQEKGRRSAGRVEVSWVVFSSPAPGSTLGGSFFWLGLPLSFLC